jgi:hypothetical protein
MKPMTFWQEFNGRAGFIWVIAVTNPVVVTLYVMFLHNAPEPMMFWLVGMLLTVIVCVISALFMGAVIFSERRRRMADFKRQVMWNDVMPYDPRKSRPAATDAG